MLRFPSSSLALLLALLFAPACSILPTIGRRPIDREDAPATLEEVRAELAANRPLEALAVLELLHRTRAISPEERLQTATLVQRALDEAIASAAEGQIDARDLTDVFEQNLPRGARARAGVEAARLLYEDDHPVAAYKMVRKVERTLPAHLERGRAGDLLARAGFDLIERDGRYFLLFDYSSRGIEALEFLVVHYPSHPTCEKAYWRLAQAYESDGKLDRAIERLEDLLVYHPDSRARAEAEARLPALRLARLTKDEYDRGELVLARTELDSWLARYPDHALESAVRATRTLCRKRLARSDLHLARYYAKIGVGYAVRLHATRALAEAQVAEAEDEADEARDLLAHFPEGQDDSPEEGLPIEVEALEIDDPLGPMIRPELGS